MTTIQARAIENARQEFVRARRELQHMRLSETRYRGIPTVNNWVRNELHGEFTYRGVPYTK